MKYVSVDLETTGLDPNTCDIVEFGAVIDDLSHPRPVDKLPRYHSYVLPKSGELYTGHPRALSMHKSIFQSISEREKGYQYLTPTDLIDEFRDFLDFHELRGKRVLFAGKNFASFDLQFLNKIPNWSKIRAAHRVLDPSAFFIKLSQDIFPPDMKTCMERAGLSGNVAHTALDDAFTVVKLIRRGLLVRESADFDSIEQKQIRGFVDAMVHTAKVESENQRGISNNSVVVKPGDDGKLSPHLIPRSR